MSLVEKEQKPTDEGGKTVSEAGQSQAWLSAVISKLTQFIASDEEVWEKATQAYLKDPWAGPLGH